MFNFDFLEIYNPDVKKWTTSICPEKGSHFYIIYDSSLNDVYTTFTKRLNDFNQDKTDKIDWHSVTAETNVYRDQLQSKMDLINDSVLKNIANSHLDCFWIFVSTSSKILTFDPIKFKLITGLEIINVTDHIIFSEFEE
jgi:hypothetical protein